MHELGSGGLVRQSRDGHGYLVFVSSGVDGNIGVRDLVDILRIKVWYERQERRLIAALPWTLLCHGVCLSRMSR